MTKESTQTAMSIRWLIVVAILMALLFFLACAPSAKRSTAEAGNIAASTSQGKMTPPRTDDNTLRMGFSVRVVGGNKSIHRRIGEQLDKQLKSFEACLKISKTEIVRIKAGWKLSTGGIFEHVEILESVPDDKALRQCFYKEINKLQLKKEKMELHGELEFATFIGTSSDWSEQKRFEKGSASK